MIHTVTFNPALDYIVRLEDLKLGEVNRVNYEQILPGGKGVNVSIVLGNLGHANRALGFSAGFTGIALEGMLEEFGVTCDFVKVAKGMTRINLKAKAKEETEVNGIGPDIQPEDIETLYAKLDELQPGDILVISGSIPSTLPDDMYERIMARMEGRGVDIVVDATRPAHEGPPVQAAVRQAQQP